MGQVIPQAGPLTLRARVARGIGQRIVWIRNGDPLSETRLQVDGEVVLETTASVGDWFTVVVRDGDDPTVIANAVFVRR
jgi:hypothetical protein